MILYFIRDLKSTQARITDLDSGNRELKQIASLLAVHVGCVVTKHDQHRKEQDCLENDSYEDGDFCLLFRLLRRK